MINKLYLVLGCFIISYIFYIRVLLVRLPKDLSMFLDGDVNVSLIITSLVSVSLCIYVITKSMQVLLEKDNVNGLLSTILTKFKNVIDKALYEVYIFPSLFIEDGYDHLSAFCDKFYTLFGSKREDFFLIISYISRITVLLAFLYDVFFNFRLDFFYQTLILLLIPISINILFFILHDFSTNFEELQSTLIINDLGIDPNTNLPITNFSFTPGNEMLDLPYYIQEYLRCSKVIGYLEAYTFLKQYYLPRLNLFIYGLYLIGWLYIFFINTRYI